jgi:polygalacturonase
MDGPVLRDSALWGTVIANCDHVQLRNTKHLNHLDIGEDDCIDVCNSQDVLVERSVAISLDDPYSCKTWGEQTDLSREWPSTASPNRNIRFEDCLAWTRCFAFKIGAGVWRPQEDITIHNAVVYDAAHAIGISASYGTADVRNVTFDTIDVERTKCECLGRSWARFAIDNRDPLAAGVFDVHVRNINVRDAGTKPVQVEGHDAVRMIHGLTFEKITMPRQTSPAKTLADLGVGEMRFADGVVVHD